jgi:hypothetical protein
MLFSANVHYQNIKQNVHRDRWKEEEHSSEHTEDETEITARLSSCIILSHNLHFY